MNDDIILTKSRQVKHCPPHFIKIPVEIDASGTLVSAIAEPDHHGRIRNWLHENVENRFFIGKSSQHLDGFRLESFGVAFEDPADATHFALLVPKFLK